MLNKISYLILIITTLFSCKSIKVIKELNKEKATVYTYIFENKEIKYLPMHHIGKKEFYDDVKAKLSYYKNLGFIVYYEEISSNINIDSVQKDIIRRKVRKIKGFSGSYTDVAKGTFFEKYIKQPSYLEFGINEHDVRADVDYLQLINEWEKMNGKINLDSVDFNTPFDAKYRKGTFYSDEQYQHIIIEYRNQYLIDLIKNSDKNKILVIYGVGHRKNFTQKIK